MSGANIKMRCRYNDIISRILLVLISNEIISLPSQTSGFSGLARRANWVERILVHYTKLKIDKVCQNVTVKFDKVWYLQKINKVWHSSRIIIISIKSFTLFIETSFIFQASYYIFLPNLYFHCKKWKSKILYLL